MKIKIFIYFLLIATIVLSIVLLMTTEPPTAYVTKNMGEPKIIQSSIQIKKSELKFCCDIQGIGKSCWLLDKYDCGYCSKYCT